MSSGTFIRVDLVQSKKVKTIKQYYRSAKQFPEDFGHIFHRSLAAAFIAFVWIVIVFARSEALGVEVDDANLAPMSQVVSVLLAITLVVFGIQLSQNYDLTSLSAALKRLREVSQAPDNLHRIQSNWPARTRIAFRKSLRLSKLDEFVLRDLDDGYPHFITRFMWDGVWYRISDSPFAELVGDDKRGATAGLHEVLICALEILSVYSRMLDRGLFISSENSGTNGCRWCHSDVRQFREELRSDMSPILLRRMSTEQAWSAINLAIRVAFVIQHEMRDHEERVHSNPLRGAEFIKECAEILVWFAYFKAKYDVVRFQTILRRVGENKNGERLWDIFEKSEKLVELYEARNALLELQNTGRSMAATRVKTAQLYVASVLTVGASTLFLVSYALGAPVFHLENSAFSKVLMAMAYFFGVTAVLVAVVFVVELISRNQG